MRSVSNLVRLVQRRLRLQWWLDVASPALLAGCTAAVPVLVVARLLGARGELAVGVAVIGVAGVTAWALSRLRPTVTTFHAAVEADERLALEGRLASALALSARTDAFAVAAVQDAERVALDPARRAQVRVAFALRMPRMAPWVPVAGCVLALCAWLQPVRVSTVVADAGVGADATPETMQARADAAEASVARALAAIEENPQAREQLQDMLAQMQQPADAAAGERDPASREAEAASRAAALEQRLSQELDSESSLQTERLKDLLASLPELEGGAKALSQALKSGDLQEALKQLEQLERDAAGSDARKAAEARQALNQMSGSLQQLAQDQRAAMQALREAGLDPSLAADPALAKQAIEKSQQLTPEQKQALQRKLQASQKACEQCRNLGSSMKPGGRSGGMSESQKQLSRAASSQSMQRALRMAMSECKNGSSLGWSMPWEMQRSGGAGQGNGKGGSRGGRGGTPKIDGNTEALKDGQLADKQESAGDGDPLGEAVARDFVRGEGTVGPTSGEQLKAVAARVEAGLEDGTEEDPVPGRLKAAHKRYFEQWKRQLEQSKPSTGGAAP